MANAKFYTYIHRKSDDNEIFYVGKGQGNRCGRASDRNNHWKNIVEKHGFYYEIVARFANEADAFANEIELIAKYRAEGVALANYASGGQGQSGISPTPDVRAKLSAALKGRPWTDSQKAARARSVRPPLTAEHKARISASRIALFATLPSQPRPLEVRMKIAASLKGRTMSPESIAKSAASRTGKALSATHKASISASKKGVPASPFSDEHRKNMSAARKAYFASKLQNPERSA